MPVLKAPDHPYAVKHFESYRKRKGFGTEFFFNRDEIPHEIQYVHTELMGIVETAEGLTGGEVFLLRLVTALTEYGMRQGRGRGTDLYPKTAPSLQKTLRDYLNHALVFHLNLAIPDHLDDIWIGDMRGYCRSAWEKPEVDNHMTFWEFVSLWASVLFSKIQFWKKRPL